LPQMVLAEFARSGAYSLLVRGTRRQVGDVRAQHARKIGAASPAYTRPSRPKGRHMPSAEFRPGEDTLKLHTQDMRLHFSIAPGPMFTLSEDYRNCIRLNVGHPWDARMEHALEVLGRLAKEAQ